MNSADLFTWFFMNIRTSSNPGTLHLNTVNLPSGLISDTFFAPPDLPSDGQDSGDSDPSGYSPCQGTHEQSRGARGHRGGSGVSSVCLL